MWSCIPHPAHIAASSPCPRRQPHAAAPPLASVPTHSRRCARMCTDTLACARTLSCTAARLHAHTRTCTRAGWQSRCTGGYWGIPAAPATVPGPCSGAGMRRDPGCCGCVSPGHFLAPSDPSTLVPFPWPRQSCPQCPAAAAQPRVLPPCALRGTQGAGGAAAQPRMHHCLSHRSPLLLGAPAAFPLPFSPPTSSNARGCEPTGSAGLANRVRALAWPDSGNSTALLWRAQRAREDARDARSLQPVPHTHPCTCTPPTLTHRCLGS